MFPFLSYRLIPILFMPSILLVGCTHAPPQPAQMEPIIMRTTTAPEQLDDGLDTGELRDVGLDPVLIDSLIARIRDNGYQNIHSVLIMKNGKLVVEEYFPGVEEDGQHRAYDRDTLHGIHSATKSVNSLLVGIAIDQGRIGGIDAKVSEFFPEYSDLLGRDGKDALCLKHLLAMTTGLAWEEAAPYTDSRNDHLTMNQSEDPLRFVLGKALLSAPGEKFNYNSGVSIALGEVVHKATGTRTDEFAAEFLFKPLGISKYEWLKYPNGLVQTGGGLYMRPRDMAKIGLLVLNGGQWQGKRIVSESWIRESVTQQAPDRTYGFQWWLGMLPVGDRALITYGALGRGGQFILVLPELKMVAVFTGWNDDNGLGDQPYDMIKKYIGPAAFQNASTDP